MQNGTRKTMDSRYDSLYSAKKVDQMKGKQLPGEIVKQIPTFMESAYKNNNKKK